MSQPVTIEIDTLGDTDQWREALDDALETVRTDLPVLGKVYDPLVRSAMWDALRQEVHFDIFDWLAEAWTIVDEIRSLKAEAGPVRQPLESWPLRGDLHPIVTLRIGPETVALPFTISITAKFGAIVLLVGGGYVKEIDAASCDVSVQVGFHGHELSKPAKLASFSTPFRHMIAEPGLRIP